MEKSPSSPPRPAERRLAMAAAPTASARAPSFVSSTSSVESTVFAYTSPVNKINAKIVFAKREEQSHTRPQCLTQQGSKHQARKPISPKTNHRVGHALRQMGAALSPRLFARELRVYRAARPPNLEVPRSKPPRLPTATSPCRLQMLFICHTENRFRRLFWTVSNTR